MKKINIDEAVEDYRGLWVSVVYPGMFDLPESRLQEEKGRSTSLLIHPFFLFSF